MTEVVRATAQAYSQQRNSIKGYTKLSSWLLSSSGLVHVNLLARVCVLVYVCECMCASVPVPLEVGYWPGWGGGSLQWRVESVPNMKVYPGSHNSSPPPTPPPLPPFKKGHSRHPSTFNGARSMSVLLFTHFSFNTVTTTSNKQTNKKLLTKNKAGTRRRSRLTFCVLQNCRGWAFFSFLIKLLKEQIRQSHVTSEVSLLTEEGWAPLLPVWGRYPAFLCSSSSLSTCCCWPRADQYPLIMVLKLLISWMVLTKIRCL